MYKNDPHQNNQTQLLNIPQPPKSFEYRSTPPEHKRREYVYYPEPTEIPKPPAVWLPCEGFVQKVQKLLDTTYTVLRRSPEFSSSNRYSLTLRLHDIGYIVRFSLKDRESSSYNAHSYGYCRAQFDCRLYSVPNPLWELKHRQKSLGRYLNRLMKHQKLDLPFKYRRTIIRRIVPAVLADSFFRLR